MRQSDVFVSVVLPLQNDADILNEVIAEISNVLDSHYTNYELVLVDDGSIDSTELIVMEALKQVPCIRCIRLARSFGLEVAVAAGLDSVIGDYIVVLEPANDPPELIPQLVNLARRGKGVVLGVRKRDSKNSFWYSIFWAFVRRFLEVKLPEGASNLQCLSRSAVNELARIKDKHRSMRLLVSGLGFNVDNISYTPKFRRPIQKNRSFFDSLDLAIGVVVAQSIRPLRWITSISLMISAINLVVQFILYFISVWGSVFALQVSLQFFLTFLVLFVLSEYVGRVLEEVRDRPLYHSLGEINSNVMVKNIDRRNIMRDSVGKDGDMHG